MSSRSAILLVSLCLAAACSTLPVDPFPDAISSNDLTQVLQACDGPITGGFGLCRVTEGTARASYIRLIFPKLQGAILGGEVVVKIRDVEKTYALPENGVLSVPFTDFFGPGVWDRADSALGASKATIRVKNDDGVEVVVSAEGEFRLRVLAKDYQPMPIDSGYQAWGCRYTVQWSSKGRSAVQAEGCD